MKWQRRFSSPDSKRQYVRGLFATIADRYDLITVLLSGGLDRRWKAQLVAAIEWSGRPRVLDLACGTGDIAFAAAANAISPVPQARSSTRGRPDHSIVATSFVFQRRSRPPDRRTVIRS